MKTSHFQHWFTKLCVFPQQQWAKKAEEVKQKNQAVAPFLLMPAIQTLNHLTVAPFLLMPAIQTLNHLTVAQNSPGVRVRQDVISLRHYLPTCFSDQRTSLPTYLTASVISICHYTCLPTYLFWRDLFSAC
ncbi:hypothetical protein ACOMHN_026193 [Nucella lapillus]